MILSNNSQLDFINENRSMPANKYGEINHQMRRHWRSTVSVVAEFFFVILPILFGTLIYIFFRVNKPPILIYILNSLNISMMVHNEFFSDNFLMKLVVENLVDGCWAFSVGSFTVISTKKNSVNTRWVYIGLALLIVLGQEILQGTWLPGTYDPVDLIFNVIGFVSAFFLLYKGWNHEKPFI